jgi:hypothetical protein
MKSDGAPRPFFNQLTDFVTMALALIEQGQDQNFDAASLQLTLEQRCHHMWRDYIYEREA